MKSSLLTLAFSAFALHGLRAEEAAVQVEKGRQLAEGQYRDLWQLTVEPTREEWVQVVFEELDGASGKGTKKTPLVRVERLVFCPGGKFVEMLSCTQTQLPASDAGAKYAVHLSGFGQSIELARATYVGEGGSSGGVGVAAPARSQWVTRRFLFADHSVEPARERTWRFSLRVLSGEAGRKLLQKAGLKEPATKDEAWSVTLPSGTGGEDAP